MQEFSVSVVADIAGVSYTSLDFALRKPLRCINTGGGRRGKERFFDPQDAVAVSLAAELRRRGLTWSAIRPIVEAFRGIDEGVLLDAAIKEQDSVLIVDESGNACIVSAYSEVKIDAICRSKCVIDLAPFITSVYGVCF